MKRLVENQYWVSVKLSTLCLWLMDPLLVDKKQTLTEDTLEMQSTGLRGNWSDEWPSVLRSTTASGGAPFGFTDSRAMPAPCTSIDDNR